MGNLSFSIYHLAFIVWLPLVALGQRNYTMVEWNVENLFHPTDDALTADDEFTPDGSRRWTYGRFYHKLNAIAQTLASAAATNDNEGCAPPDFVALAEVEDDSTLVALTERSVMSAVGYRYVRTHGCDGRGINVALLYQPYLFRPIGTREVVVERQTQRWTGERFNATRNLLYVVGETIEGDTLHIIVCHLPSQASGTRHADHHREHAAATLRALVDSIMTATTTAALIVTGDFNDEEHSTVVRQVVGNDLRRVEADFEGTYRYRGDWSHLDHIICSSRVEAERVHVVRSEWLLEPNRTVGGDQPRRTFRGTSYHGGISDHLPLYVRFRIKN